jgi:hypothetical protein
VAAGLLGLVGCTSARYVQVTRDGGIVAIPENTNVWPTYYRDKAMALIQEKCPDGYEIVWEEEAVTGTVAHTNAYTDTREAPALVFGGAEGAAERTPRKKGPGERERYSESFGGVAIPLGETEQTTRQTTTYRNITEWHIHYRKAAPAGG